MNHLIAPSLLLLVTFPFLAACGATVVTGDDGDGTGNCLADPTCSPNEYEASECAPGDGGPCRSVVACGTEIFCQEEYYVECYEGPYCPTGYEVDTCPVDANCYAVSACDYTIYCMDEVQCDAYPSCDTDWRGCERARSQSVPGHRTSPASGRHG